MNTPSPCRENPLRPPLTLALGPAGSGKTDWVLQQFLEAEGRALLVVASPVQAETLAAQIAERLGVPPADVQGAVLPFRRFVTELCRSAPEDNIRVIGSAFQRLALEDRFRALTRPDSYFGKMREAPGFISALSERIREWKLACITPDDFLVGSEVAAALLDDPSFPLKTAEIARLFRAYQDFLHQNRLRDQEDCLHLATARIREVKSPLPNNANRVLIEGFLRLNRAQRVLLSACAERGLASGKPEIDVALTLPYDPDRSLLFAATEKTLQTLRTEFKTHEMPFSVRPGSHPAELSLLESRIFEAKEPDIRTRKEQTDTLETPRPLAIQEKSVHRDAHTAACLSLFDAPNLYVEAEMVARAFRRMHDAEGIAWNDCAIILRTLGDYAPILSAVFERYGIPLGVDGPETLTDNPLLKTVMHLMDVVRYDWRREDVLAFLKSSYTPTDKLAADALRRRARSTGVREGKSAWLRLAETAAPDVKATLLAMAEMDSALRIERGAPRDYADRVREIIEVFGLQERIEQGETLRAARDRAALYEGLEVLDALTEMAHIAGQGALSFGAFHDALREAWQDTSALAVPEGDRVRVVEPYDSRDRPMRVAAVMGLTERVFPRRITEDPFLRDEERAALRQAAGLDLEEQKGRADDERLFFYLAVTAPTERLILSFPRATNESDTLPSFYLDEVRAAFAGVTAGMGEGIHTVSRTLADVAPQFEEAVSQEDTLLAACANLFDPGADSGSRERERRILSAARILQESLALAETSSYDIPETAQGCTIRVRETRASAIRAVLASRGLPRLPCLNDAALRADFATKKSVFSVSELETYRRCPFQYLLRHVLRLQPEEDGANPKAQGTVLHSVLRHYFRRRAACSPQESTLDVATMQKELHTLLEETLQTEQLDASPHRLRMTRRMLTDALSGFAEREVRFAPLFAMKPTYFELAFGTSVAGEALFEEDDREAGSLRETNSNNGPHASTLDPASNPEPLCIMAKDGGSPVRVCGTIDRVDVDATGYRAMVLDYKLGKPPEYPALQRGDSLQMPLYLLAMERLFGMTGAVGCYDSMREPGRPRLHRLEHTNTRQFGPVVPLENGETVKPLNRAQYEQLTQGAEATAVQIARSIAAGRIEATPGDHCRTCPYSDVCRTTTTGGHDGESLIPSPPGTPAQ